jgi:hypothetical protein
MVVINIDTSKDSPEEIRKTIRYLQEMVGESAAPPKPEPLADFIGVDFFKEQPEEQSAPKTETKPEPAKTQFKDPATILREGARRAVEKKPEKTPSKSEKKDEEEATIVAEDTSDAFIEIVEYD